MNVGFDLDRIFISNPPYVPEKIIRWLHKGNSNGSLKYRIPGRLEQIVRIFSHYPLFRQPIKDKIIKKLKIDRYVDDDLFLLNFLADKNYKTKFFWLNKKISKTLGKNLFAIKHISKILK